MSNNLSNTLAYKQYVLDEIAKVSGGAGSATAPQTELILNSSTEGSTKQFKLTIDDTGTLTIAEIVEEAE